MAYIDNTDTKKEINDAIRGNAVSNLAPTMVNNSIQPVINVNPKDYRRCNIIKRNSASNSTSATVYTTPADKDFFLSAATLTVCKDATSTSTLSTLTIVPNTETSAVQLLDIASLTLTAQDGTISITLPNPIQLARNSAINVTNTTNVANIRADATIIGYTVEP